MAVTFCLATNCSIVGETKVLINEVGRAADGVYKIYCKSVGLGLVK